MSGRANREARRAERPRREEQAEAGRRRQTLIKGGSAAAFLALAVVAVLIVISQSQTSGGDSGNIQHASEVDRELAGIPQSGMVLGKPSTRVTVLEFADLQCPFCKAFAEESLPQVIENRVRSGEAKLEFRNFTIIGPESTPAGAAAIAAGEQGRGWNFVETFYRNQGSEDSGYVTDAFLTAVAKAAGVADLTRWNRDRKSQRTREEVARSTRQAEGLGFTGTPSFAVEGPSTSGPNALDAPVTVGQLESAVLSAG